MQCFVEASQKGWNEFLHGDPAPGIALIRKDNPDNPDDVIAYVIKTLRDRAIVEDAETKKMGIGAMSEQRGAPCATSPTATAEQAVERARLRPWTAW